MGLNMVPSKPKKAEKTAISEALRAEVIRIATEGSVDEDGALTPHVLSRIEQVAKTGRDMLVALAVSPSNLAALIKRKRGGGLWGGPDYGSVTPDYGSVTNGDDIDDIGGVLSSSPTGENFAMTALRELIAGMRRVNMSPDRLVEALATARREGLLDVAKRIEDQLGLKSSDAPSSNLDAKVPFPNGEDGNDILDGGDDEDQSQVGSAP